MKKSSSPGAKISLAKRSGASRSTSAHHVAGFASSDHHRLQVAPSSALAVIEPPGPRAGELRRVRFGYFKPEAREVHVVGSFNGWDPRATPLHRDALGDWSAEIDLPTGDHRYRFFVDGEWRDDPAAQQTAQNPYGGYDGIVAVV